ncbi:MAG: hypothetical protein SFW36_21190 [Leptolyngbyaceae cyanobacterium bins.59]|nr:hypothetical protein [Leptolyngbyaceae cyanobacterium bins.59]
MAADRGGSGEWAADRKFSLPCLHPSQIHPGPSQEGIVLRI